MIDSESWLPDEIDKMNITRWKAQFVSAQTPLGEKFEIFEEPVSRAPIPKDFSIRRDLPEKHGYSEDCGRCRLC
jgi:hypothetical protein